MQNICIVCRDNKSQQVEQRLNQLINVLKRYIKDYKNFQNDYHWNINIRCKYGIPCSKVNKGRINQLSREAGQMLNAFIESDNIKKYPEILHLLAGYFPNVYSSFERKVKQKL